MWMRMQLMPLKDFMLATNNRSGSPLAKLVSLDFGKKRVGVAITDKDRQFVFPLVDIVRLSHCRSLEDESKLLWDIRKVCRSNEIGNINESLTSFLILISEPLLSM